MKNLLLSAFILLTFLCAKCEEDTPKDPIDLLPPATQTGENTFGCLVDGEAFTPDGRPMSLIATYSSSGEGYLYVSGSRTESNIVFSPAVGLENLAIIEGKTYELSDREEGNAYGSLYTEFDNTYTYQQAGELFISKHDPESRIVSGTFWFNIRSRSGILYQISKGRFDIKY